MATYNVGGPSISPERFHEVVTAIKNYFEGDVYHIPQVICLTEFKPTPEAFFAKAYHQSVNSLLGGKFWFVPQNTLAQKGGVAFLIASSVSPQPPTIQQILVDKIYQVSIHAHQDLGVKTDIIGVYGSNIPRERRQIEVALEPWVHRNALIMGDFNGVTCDPFRSTGVHLDSNSYI